MIPWLSERPYIGNIWEYPPSPPPRGGQYNRNSYTSFPCKSLYCAKPASPNPKHFTHTNGTAFAWCMNSIVAPYHAAVNFPHIKIQQNGQIPSPDAHRLNSRSPDLRLDAVRQPPRQQIRIGEQPLCFPIQVSPLQQLLDTQHQIGEVMIHDLPGFEVSQLIAIVEQVVITIHRQAASHSSLDLCKGNTTRWSSAWCVNKAFHK